MWPHASTLLLAAVLVACGAEPEPTGSDAAAARTLGGSATPTGLTVEERHQLRYGPALDSLLAGHGQTELTLTEADSLLAAVTDSTGRFYALHGAFGPVVYDRFDLDADGATDLFFASNGRSGTHGTVYLSRPNGYVLAGPLGVSSDFAVCPNEDGSVVRSFEEDPGAGQGRGATYWAAAVSAGRVEEVDRVRVMLDSLGRHPRVPELQSQARSPSPPCKEYSIYNLAT